MSGSLALETVDVPSLETAHEGFEEMARAEKGTPLTNDERIDALRNATKFREILRHFNERVPELNAQLERVAELEDRISRLEEQRGLEGNASANAGGFDDADLPSPGTASAARNGADAGTSNTGGLPSPGTASGARNDASADSTDLEGNTDDDYLPSPGTSNSTVSGSAQTRPIANVMNDVDPRTVHVVDREDVGELEDLEMIRPRSEDHPAAPTFEQVEIADSAEDADDRVILYDPSAPGAGKDLVESTDVLPTNPDALER